MKPAILLAHLTCPLTKASASRMSATHASLRIAYLVMPPGHNKAKIHDPENHLVKASTTIPWDCTESLRILGAEAQQSCVWDSFNSVWAREIEDILDSGCWVVMVPSIGVGKARGWNYLGTGRLEPRVWIENHSGRGVCEGRHLRCIEDAVLNNGVLFNNNEDIANWALQTAIHWLRIMQAFPVPGINTGKQDVGKLGLDD